MVYEVPDGEDPRDLADQTFDSFRAATPVAPWNKRPVFGPGLPHWEVVSEIDTSYHVRRVTLPAPGSMTQLMELVAHTYPSLLDRTAPLWEAYVVDGLENDRFAVFMKGHHSLTDGVSGMRMFYGSLSEHPGGGPQPMWAVPRSHRKATSSRDGLPAMMLKRATAAAGAFPELVKLLPGGIRLALRGGAPPFSAARTPSMGSRVSSARTFATLDLSLDEVRRIGKGAGGTVNDVLLSVFDDAMQRYLAESGCGRERRLVTTLPVSLRRDDDGSSNAVTAALVALGEPNATPAERLVQVAGATRSTKDELHRAPPVALQLQLLSLMATLEVREQTPLVRKWIPNISNFILSNIPGGPDCDLYLGNARLAAFYAVPIVAASQPANFTVVKCNDRLCVGIGATRNLLPDATRLARLAETSYAELRASASEVSEPT
jgi:WS/DGAT/MGAT family acyltransferase